MVKKLYTNSELIRAQRSSINNKDHLMRSVSCGCYSCETIILVNDIRDWKLEVDGGMTAICPPVLRESDDHRRRRHFYEEDLPSRD